MTVDEPEQAVRRIAGESLAAGDVTGWFEQLYSAAYRGDAVVPWDRGGPHPLLVEWAATQAPPESTARALVVGAGPGGDAELVAGLGFATVAFDVSATAVRAAGERFPDSTVDYMVADLLDPPADWRAAFDLVIESLTVQSMPRSVRTVATANVSSFVAPGGTLVVVASALEDGDDADSGPPWPLTKAEVDAFAVDGLRPEHIGLYPATQEPTAHRWLAEFRRARC